MRLTTLFGLILAMCVAPAAMAFEYGKHCGEGRETGKPVPHAEAKDRLDAACKYHDVCTFCGEYMLGRETKANVKLRQPKLKVKKGKLKVKWDRKDKAETVVRPARICQDTLKARLKRLTKRDCTPTNKRFNLKKCTVAYTGLAYAEDVNGFEPDRRVQQCINVLSERFPDGEWKGTGTLVCEGDTCTVKDRAP